MKTQEELTTLKREFEALTEKLKALSEEELEAVFGGDWEGYSHHEVDGHLHYSDRKYPWVIDIPIR